MNTASLIELAKTNWPLVSVLLAAVLPTVANGLANYPQAQGWLRLIIDLLSWSTSRDSKGTWKLPFMRSEPPTVNHKAKAVRKPKAPSGPAVILPLLMTLAVLTQPGCQWFKSKGTAVADGVVDCAKDGLKDRVTHMVPLVLSYLKDAQDASWQQALLNIGVDYGNDVIGCATKSVIEALKDTGTKPGISPIIAAKEQMAKERGELLLNGLKLKFKDGK